jgi:hypothetical protein
MTARDGGPGMNDAAKAHAFSRRSFLFGLSVLAVVAFFDARPAAAQYVGVGPFGIYLGGHGHYRRGYYRHHGGYHRRHYSYRYGHRHHGGGHRHHGGGHGHHGGGGGGGAPVPKL